MELTVTVDEMDPFMKSNNLVHIRWEGLGIRPPFEACIYRVYFSISVWMTYTYICIPLRHCACV